MPVKKSKLGKLQLAIITLTSITSLIACGSGNFSNFKSLMESQDNEELTWENSNETVPVKVSYINDRSIDNGTYDVTPMLESTIYQSWVKALDLLKTEISELDGNGYSKGLVLKNILLVEKKRLEIDAGGSIKSAPATAEESTSNFINAPKESKLERSLISDDKKGSLFSNNSNNNNKNNNNNKKSNGNQNMVPKPLVVTNQAGVEIKLYLDGQTSEFATIVKFVDKKTGRRLDIELSENLSYWKMGFGTDSTANLDASSIISMFLKLPPMVAGALGSFLKKIGTINFFLKLKSTQHWVDHEANVKNIMGLGKVSKLSYLFAKDVFSQLCEYEGFEKESCQTKIFKWSKNPVTEQIKSYAVMPIVGCTKDYRNENTIPLYTHYVKAPIVEDEEIDFFKLDPNRETVKLNIYKKLTSTDWRKQGGFVGGKFGTFTQEVDSKFCGLSSEELSTKRCISVKFGSHYYENTCNGIESSEIKDFGYSFYSSQNVYLR